MVKERSIKRLPLDGGILCFDFINTVHSRKDNEAFDYLTDYPNFLLWCRKVNILSKDRIKTFEEFNNSYPEKGATALNEIKKVRENMYLLFSGIALGNTESLPEKVLNQFNHKLQHALSHLSIVLRDDSSIEAWENHKTEPDEPLWAILKSAYELIKSNNFHRIKECPACGWLFLDHTKNNKRRWCSPTTCGSIEKSKKYYQKKKNKTS